MHSLDGTFFHYSYLIFGVETDEELIYRMTVIGLVYTVVVALWSLIQPAPYGRYSKGYYGPTMNAKLAWMLQEGPACVVPMFLMWKTSCTQLKSTANIIAISLFMIHYIQRSIIFPLRLSPETKPSPVITAANAFLFCFYNGFLQSHHLTNVYHVPSHPIWVILGAILFLSGMYINITSDGILMSLKSKPKTDTDVNGYKIPSGFLFEYISGSNYFGEILEWWGFALVTQFGFPQLVFAIFVSFFLGMRAFHHHQWYKEKFGSNYPQKRKAVIPFIL